MKIYREITPLKPEEVFILCHFQNARFNYPLHNHPEYELCLTLNSRGNRIVGDSVAKYGEKDLVLIGPNVYHRWDDEDLPELRKKEPSVLFVQFDKNLFEKTLLSKAAFYSIRHMLKRSMRGIRFFGAPFNTTAARLLKLEKLKGFEAVLEFLSILHDLSLSKEQQLLASEGFAVQPESFTSRRITDVYEYISEHFREKIQVGDVAELVNMSESAFSHFFKKCTNKSFTQYLVETRIGLACKLLVETNDTIGQICFQCGFNNVSNFNRLFKKYKDTTPLLYRRKMEDKVTYFDFTDRYV